MPLTSLLQPIPESDVTGVDVSFLPEFDAIQEARRADDPSLDQGEWARDLKTADWPRVARLCREALSARTKDLRIAGWYLEARTQIDGLAGLAEGYALIAALCEGFWMELHPRDDDSEERLGCLRWIVGQSPHWLRLITAPPREDALPAITATLDAIGRIDVLVEAHVPGEGPSTTLLRDALERMLPGGDALLGDAPLSAASALSAPTADGGTHAAQSTTDAVPDDEVTTAASGIHDDHGSAGRIGNRAEALRHLRDVAHFFRETEPHSPVAYLADKAARWGEMPLHEWLGRVLGEGEALKRMRDVLDLPEGGKHA